MKAAELPSIIGTSAPSISMSRLSMCKPLMAASKCSTVATEVPHSLSRAVQRVVFVSVRYDARMSADAPPWAYRRNTIPVPASAGHKATAAGAPLWMPLPRNTIGLQTVVCRASGSCSARCMLCPGSPRRSRSEEIRDTACWVERITNSPAALLAAKPSSLITRSGKFPGQIFDSTPAILNAGGMPRLGAIHLGPAGRARVANIVSPHSIG